MSNKKTDMKLGVAKWFSEEKMFGVIEEVNTGQEVFLHFTNWIDNNSVNTISDTKLLVFETMYTRNKISAKNCRFFNNSEEDFKLIHKLTQELNSYLYIKGQNNRETKISTMLNFRQEDLEIYSQVLNDFFYNVDDSSFFKKTEELKELYGAQLINTHFFLKESLNRFNSSIDNEFKRMLVSNNFVDLNEIELGFILKNYKLDNNLVTKLENHPEFISNIEKCLFVINDDSIKIRLLLIGVEKKLEHIHMLIDFFISSLSIDNFIESMSELKIGFKRNKYSYDLQSEIEKYLSEKNDKGLNYKAYKNNLIKLNMGKLIDDYSSFINKDDFLNIMSKYKQQSKLVEAVLLKSNDQELLEYIIEEFENFRVDSYQMFFDFGTQHLYKLNEPNQTLYLKKLFHLKIEDKLSFNKSDLSSFIDISVLKSASDNKAHIDFSTFLIIDLIARFSSDNGFLATRELINSVLKILQFDKKKKVQIDKYFDKCDGYGREILPSTDLQIIKDKFATRQNTINYYFIISFPYNEAFVADVREIPGSKYNDKMQYWAAPLRSQSEVLDFARKHNFLLDLKDGNKYQHNRQLIQIEKKEKEKPIGNSFCCGQEAQQLSESGRKFWWCNQNPCFQNNIKKHDDWRDFTLYDFAMILNLSIEEQTKEGLVFESGIYTRFAALLNSFNRLLERIYCDGCGDILYPAENSNYNTHSVTKFICKNENCTQHLDVVYLNNCLNGQCNAIIDSRKSKKCQNGWYICNDCGSCCSHAAYERRLRNLRINGGIEYDGLVYAVDNKIGHLEKAEYYCYKCGQFMTEYSESLYKCSDCKISYDLFKYNHLFKKQIHKHLRVKNYPNKSYRVKSKLKSILLQEKNELINSGRTIKQIFGILFNKEIEIDNESYCLKNLNDKQLTNEIFD